MTSSTYRDQSGITGLETAIILIAFVVVAAVFAYTVLSAGLFATQESQEAVYEGLEETKATLELDGSFMALDSDDNNNVDGMKFTLKNALLGYPIDFSPNSGTTAGSNYVVISYQDKDQWKEDLEWSITRLGNDDGDNLLELDEKMQITISNLESGTINGLNPDLQKGTQFYLEVKPPQGATILIERTTPREIDKVMNLQ
jgi:flagellin FlaB